ncbi:carbon-nitrogen hydrolase family protein [Rhizobium sp. IBUN]|uniref:carbon-nitrogen hydrolase family protein n=1 Tax=Rhizobium sp. IBUN TaxID=1042326 RepID=UPI00041B4FE2|nr:carbon-nitrogen hydrolase family protein [Rhizobium sp. IBUN]
MVKVCVVEWPDGLVIDSYSWKDLADRLRTLRPDILVTNEMPFGAWLPKALPFDLGRAREWAQLHQDGLDALGALAKAVISSRPVLYGETLANEAFVIENGKYGVLHHKHIFPAEEGWQEDGWFSPCIPGFETKEIAGLRVGVLLCTELMFPDRARALGKQGAHLITVPRASGRDMTYWRTAGAMAAIVSGAYVVSSNRVGSVDSAPPHFGGGGFAFDPTARTVATTTHEASMVVIEIDTLQADAAKHAYPVYVSERHLRPRRGNQNSDEMQRSPVDF